MEVCYGAAWTRRARSRVGDERRAGADLAFTPMGVQAGASARRGSKEHPRSNCWDRRIDPRGHGMWYLHHGSRCTPERLRHPHGDQRCGGVEPPNVKWRINDHPVHRHPFHWRPSHRSGDRHQGDGFGDHPGDVNHVHRRGAERQWDGSRVQALSTGGVVDANSAEVHFGIV